MKDFDHGGLVSATATLRIGKGVFDVSRVFSAIDPRDHIAHIEHQA